MSLTLPNLLTLARMGLIPLFVIAMLQGQPSRALAIFAVAGLTDALDGFIARFFDQESKLGAYLDPMADKLLLVTAFVLLTVPGLHQGVRIPLWITVLVIARDVLIVVVSLIFFLAMEVTRFPPMALSKVNTAVQIGGVVLVLLSGIYPDLEAPTVAAVYLVAALTVLSGVSYIFRANRLVAEKQHATA